MVPLGSDQIISAGGHSEEPINFRENIAESAHARGASFPFSSLKGMVAY